MKRRLFSVLGIALTLFYVWGGQVWAKDKSQDASTVDSADSSTDSDAPAESSVSDQEILNNRLAALEKNSVEFSTEHNYLDISTQKGNVVLKIGGTVQGDFRTYYGGPSKFDDFVPIGENPNYEEGATAASTNKSTNTFLDRKVRLDLVALFDHLVGFRFQNEFGSTAQAIQDAYAFFTPDTALQFQIGQFKTPIGLERLQSDTDTLFVERSLVTDLVPNRDYGFEVYGSAAGKVNYGVEISNGTPDNWTPNNADASDLSFGKEFSARVFSTPFKGDGSFLQGLGAGISGSWQWLANWNSNAEPNYFVTSLGQQQFFAYRTGVVPQGSFYHFSPQGYYFNGPFGLLAEYVQAIQEVGTSAAVKKNLVNQAWQVEGSWVIGGKAGYQGAVADTPLDLSQGHWGALELAARVHELTIDDKAFNAATANNFAATNSAEQAEAFGFGANWIFDPNFKLAFDWEKTNFTEGTQVTAVAGTLKTLNPEEVFTVRAQANF